MNGLVRSAHDLSQGGLAVAAAEMCLGGRLGMQLNIVDAALFYEVNGCMLDEVSSANAYTFEKQFAGLAFTQIGTVTQNPFLNICESVSISVDDLVHAFNNPETL